MKTKLIITGIAASAAFIVTTHLATPAHQLEVFALFLALTSCVYGGIALTPAGAPFGRVEFPFVVVVFISAVLGLVLSPVWIAVGYLLHGGWDMLHHFKQIKTPVLRWFPPVCAVFDVVIAGFVLWLGLSI